MIRHLMCVVMAVAVLSGCAGCKVGDGKVDVVDAGVIRVAVGLAMSSRPESVRPAYAVSTALLKVISPDHVSEASVIDLAIARELDEIGLSGPERLAFINLASAIRGIIIDQLKSSTTEESRRVMIYEVLRIVRESAEARLAMENKSRNELTNREGKEKWSTIKASF